MSECSGAKGLMGGAVTGKPVTECQDLGEVEIKAEAGPSTPLKYASLRMTSFLVI